MKMMQDTEGIKELIGLNREFKNIRDGELYNSVELRQLAELQILDPEGDKAKDDEEARKGAPIRNEEEWSADPFKL